MSGPIAPIWFVFPIAGLAMVFTAAYLIALREAPNSAISEPRRRLRTAATWMIMIALPLSAYGFSVATTRDPKTFMLVWVTVTVLLAFILIFAVIDLLMLSAQHRQLTHNHRAAVRAAHREIAHLPSGTQIFKTNPDSTQPEASEDSEHPDDD